MKNKIIDLSSKSFVVTTHRSIMPCIPGDDLRKYLLNNKCGELLYITHPLLLLQESYELTSTLEEYSQTKLTKNSKAFHWKLPETLLYLKDFIYTIYWSIRTNKKYDIYIGMNNLNAAAGIVLKKLGVVKKVVYYTIDLYPDRFNNDLINKLYHQLDIFCVEHCDETWNVSPFLEKYRESGSQKNNNANKQFTVPIGIWYNEMERVNDKKIKQNKLVYVGHLKDFYGVDLAISALPLVKKAIPEVYLEIIGDGEQRVELENLARKLNVLENIKFHGWKDKKSAEKIISDAAVGLAPFNVNIIDEKVKNGDPAKIKDYLALGIPVVMTNASINANKITESGCGIVIDSYDPQLFADAIIKLLSNNKLHNKFRENAFHYIEQFDWNNLFTLNISRIIN